MTIGNNKESKEKMKHDFVKEWRLIPQDIAKSFIMYCVNESVEAFAEENCIKIKDNEGFASPYMEIFYYVVKESIPRRWVLDYIQWAVVEAVSDFAEKHGMIFISDYDFSEEAFDNKFRDFNIKKNSTF